MKIPIGVSKRHVHLTKEVYEKLFGSSELEIRNYLNQPGEFASTSTVDVKWNDKSLERVRIVGPFRKYNQVELSQSDAEFLGIKPPVRKSGDIERSHPIILCNLDQEVCLDEGAVIAQRHIHIDSESAKKFNLKDEEKVLVYKDSKEIYDAYIKIQDPAFIELHIDNDEAAFYDLKQDDEVEVSKCGK